jgi:hypothetical protein
MRVVNRSMHRQIEERERWAEIVFVLNFVKSTMEKPVIRAGVRL